MRDAQGRKMSKSLGNGIDPLEVIDQYGADALRFTLATGNSPGQRHALLGREGERLAATLPTRSGTPRRFVLMNLSDGLDGRSSCPRRSPSRTSGFSAQYNALVREVTDNLEKFELGIAVQKLYDFIWDVFCDWYIELVQDPPAGGRRDRARRRSRCSCMS